MKLRPSHPVELWRRIVDLAATLGQLAATLGELAARLGQRVSEDLAARASPRTLRAIGAGLAAAVTMALMLRGYAHCDCLYTGADDAYITFRYARNLALGHGLVFNPGSATDSASSFLYTVLLAVFYRASFDDLPFVATVIGVGCTALIAAVVHLAVLERTQRPLLSLALGACTATHGMLSGWAISGMETSLFTLLVAASSYRIFIRGAFGWPEAALVLATALTRYEGFLLVAAWFVLGAVRYLRRAEPRPSSILRQFAIVAGVLGLFLAFKYITYGTVLPHAFVLKNIASVYTPAPREVWSVWSKSAAVFLGLGFVGLALVPRDAAGTCLLAYCLLSVLSVALGPSSDGARYSVHLLPLLAMLACAPLSTLLRHAPALAFVACGGLIWQSYASFAEARMVFRVGAGHANCRREIGQYLERSFAPGTRVLSSDIGVIAYNAPDITFVDAVGLTSKEVLELRRRGLSVDPALEAMRPAIIADTCHGACAAPNEFSSYGWLANPAYWLTPLPGHEYSSRMINGRLLHRCISPDGISFGAAKFALRER